MAQRPNMLWLSCEDMSPHLGCYGDSTVPTPNLDRLAREGVRFTNAFCTAGVCAPSRNAIITGMYQTATGGHNMRTLANTFPEKTGLPRAYSIVPPPAVRAFPEYLRANGYYCTNNEKTDYQFDAPPTVWDETSPRAHWKNRADGQPFFAVFNNIVTHESQVWARAKLPLRVSPDRIQIPAYYPDTKTVRQDMARHFSNIADMDSWVGTMLKELEENGLLANTIIFFWSDHGDGLPFVKRELYDRGLRVPLLVRFPNRKNAGTTRSDLVSMIDLAPTVLTLAGLPTPKQMQGQALFAKNGGTSGNPPRRYVFAARDRMDTEYDRVRAVHDGRYEYIRNFLPEKPLYQDLDYRKQQPMMAELLRLRDEGRLNTVQMQWFRPTKPAEELYDLKTDPYQLHNLAADAAFAPQLKRLQQAFAQWQHTVPDFGAIPEKELIRQWWHGADKPPITADPTLARVNGRLQIQCPTEGASIGYRIGNETTGWRVYTGPFVVAPATKISCLAQRIGYQKSNEVVATL
ncbi:sulfatase-like hydrolase/transferase [Fibrella rubiginis]|uniref:sulfatase-like hydrolase/transferase n=1 Tax=Fibrella rubiginis TaxID=2817060 RepID=UPI00286E4795|nr:sulfatase-like hydrolase/transferase [Fibrella rubiginis]